LSINRPKFGAYRRRLIDIRSINRREFIRENALGFFGREQ